MAAIPAPLRRATATGPAKPQEQRRPIQPLKERRSWIARWLGRSEPTAYHRCLAVHLHFAGPRSALH